MARYPTFSFSMHVNILSDDYSELYFPLQADIVLSYSWLHDWSITRLCQNTIPTAVTSHLDWNSPYKWHIALEIKIRYTKLITGPSGIKVLYLYFQNTFSDLSLAKVSPCDTNKFKTSQKLYHCIALRQLAMSSVTSFEHQIESTKIYTL